MPSQEEISQQQALLRTHRETLAILLQQQAQHTLAYTPPATMHGIAEARSNIERVKSVLRGWGVAVDDHPDDARTGGAGVIPGRGMRWRRVALLLVAAGVGLLAMLILVQNLAPSNARGVAPNPTHTPPATPATAPEAAAPPAASATDCFAAYFDGIPAEQIATIEAGGSLGVGMNQPRDGQIGIKLTSLQQPIGAIRLYTFAAGNLFKIESIVDHTCHAIDSFSNMRVPSADKHSVTNYGVLKIEYADHGYTLYLYYHINQVEATLRQLDP